MKFLGSLTHWHQKLEHYLFKVSADEIDHDRSQQFPTPQALRDEIIRVWTNLLRLNTIDSTSTIIQHAMWLLYLDPEFVRKGEADINDAAVCEALGRADYRQDYVAKTGLPIHLLREEICGDIEAHGLSTCEIAQYEITHAYNSRKYFGVRLVDTVTEALKKHGTAALPTDGTNGIILCDSLRADGTIPEEDLNRVCFDIPPKNGTKPDEWLRKLLTGKLRRILGDPPHHALGQAIVAEWNKLLTADISYEIVQWSVAEALSVLAMGKHDVPIDGEDLCRILGEKLADGKIQRYTGNDFAELMGKVCPTEV